ncbi:hypothetical protein THAOC_30669, partial [Thalassiosira oceanica]
IMRENVRYTCNDYMENSGSASPGQFPVQTHTPLAFEHVADDEDAGAAGGVMDGAAGVDEGVGAASHFG